MYVTTVSHTEYKISQKISWFVLHLSNHRVESAQPLMSCRKFVVLHYFQVRI